MPRVLQCVFYLLQYRKEDVCQEGSNKFHWKLAHQHFNDSFLDRLVAYSPLGLRNAPQSAYTTVNYIERFLEGLTAEEVEA